MKHLSLIASVLAVLWLTACEKGLEDGIEDAGNGQVKNSVLQVRTRGGSGDEATVAYPLQVFVFSGDECKAAQTIGDEGQTLNIPLVEGTYTVYAVGVNLTGTITGIYDANTATMQANIDAALATVTDGDISGWEVPTTAEAHLMYDAREAIGDLTAGSYLCHGGTGYRAFKPSDAAFSTSSSNVKASTVLRPVVTININKE